MNRDQIRAALPILQAFAEGKTVQFRPVPEYRWTDCPDLRVEVVMERPESFRIKPEPREWYLRFERTEFIPCGKDAPGAIRVREVLD